MTSFDYKGAKAAGYSDEEIRDYLGEKPEYKPTNQPGFGNFFSNIINNLSNFTGNFNAPNGRQPKQEEQIEISPKLLKKMPDFDVEAALQSGYTPSEIEEYIEENAPKRSTATNTARAASLYGLGAMERLLFPYEAAAASMASKEAQQVPYRENIMEDIERLEQQKQAANSYRKSEQENENPKYKPTNQPGFGNFLSNITNNLSNFTSNFGNPTGKQSQEEQSQFDEQDQALYDSLVNQLKHPEEAEQFIPTEDISIRGLAETATGVDLEPEGFLEKAASWSGFIKDPKRYVKGSPFTSKDMMKLFLPSGTDVMRGLGAATGYEMAKNGDFGPAATMAAEVIGDLAGGGVAGVGKAIMKPRQSLAKLATWFSPKDARETQQAIINEFREAGIQADIGTITGSDLVKAAQSRIEQSGLVGQDLEKFKELTKENIKEQYRTVAEGLGEHRFATINEAGETGKEYLTHIRDAEKLRIGELYESARGRVARAGKKATVMPTNLAFAVRSIEKALKPGAIKSTEQQAVLGIIEKLKGDIYAPGNQLKPAMVQDLINDKVALNDIINYEVQGGQKQLLKNLVKELDSAIISYGKQDKEFVKEYMKANKDFSEHAKTFRNDNINRILTSRDPMILMNKMNSVQGLKDLEKALVMNPEGQKVFGDLKRFKLDQMMGNKMIDNTSNQLKMGQFKNLLKNPKDAQIVKELVGNEAFKELIKLQKAVGKLQETASKFYNASKSAAVGIDAALVGKGIADLGHVLAGNPWPIARDVAGFFGVKYIGRLMADPTFLRTVENAILASEQKNIPLLLKIGELLETPIKAAMEQEKSRSPNQDEVVPSHTKTL